MNDRDLENNIIEQAEALNEDKFADTEPFPERDPYDVDDMAASAGVETNDFEPLRMKEKLEERDKNPWELDPDSNS